MLDQLHEVVPAAPTRSDTFSGAEDAAFDASTAPPKSTILENIDPIENTQQFLSWFDGVEQNMEKGQEDIYRSVGRLRGQRKLSNATSRQIIPGNRDYLP